MNGYHDGELLMPNVILVASSLDNCNATALGLVGQSSISYEVAAPADASGAGLQTETVVEDLNASDLKQCDGYLDTDLMAFATSEVDISDDLSAYIQSYFEVTVGGELVATIGMPKALRQLGYGTATVASDKILPGMMDLPRCVPCNPFPWVFQPGGTNGPNVTITWKHLPFVNAVEIVVLLERWRYAAQILDNCMYKVMVAPDGNESGPVYNIQNSSMLSRLPGGFTQGGCGIQTSVFPNAGIPNQGIA